MNRDIKVITQYKTIFDKLDSKGTGQNEEVKTSF